MKVSRPIGAGHQRSPAEPDAGPQTSARRAPGRGSPTIPENELTPNVQSVVATLMDEVERLKNDLDHSRQRMLELENIADEDPLLPILNRRAFERELARSLAFARRYQIPSCLVYFDLDGFKQVNDRFGHGAGDAVLMQVADVLNGNVRESDVVGRMGGDEFAVVLVHADYTASQEKAQRLLEALTASPVDVGGTVISIAASAGCTLFRDDDTVVSIIERADHAMYDHKRQ